jgi:hypothetical protein
MTDRYIGSTVPYGQGQCNRKCRRVRGVNPQRPGSQESHDVIADEGHWDHKAANQEKQTNAKLAKDFSFDRNGIPRDSDKMADQDAKSGDTAERDGEL